MTDVRYYLFLGTVTALILSLSFKLSRHLCKSQNRIKVWSWLDVVASFIAMVLALSGLFITITV